MSHFKVVPVLHVALTDSTHFRRGVIEDRRSLVELFPIRHGKETGSAAAKQIMCIVSLPERTESTMCMHAPQIIPGSTCISSDTAVVSSSSFTRLRFLIRSANSGSHFLRQSRSCSRHFRDIDAATVAPATAAADSPSLSALSFLADPPCLVSNLLSPSLLSFHSFPFP